MKLKKSIIINDQEFDELLLNVAISDILSSDGVIEVANISLIPIHDGVAHNDLIIPLRINGANATVDELECLESIQNAIINYVENKL